MNDEIKKVPFKWQCGEDVVSLHIGTYESSNTLYVGMICYEDDGPEPFADMTVNINGYSQAPNEAFINGDMGNDILAFIKENKLGKVLPYTVQSGYGRYAVVAFDLEKLKEFDPIGIDEYKREHGIADKKPVKAKKKSHDMER